MKFCSVLLSLVVTLSLALSPRGSHLLGSQGFAIFEPPSAALPKRAKCQRMPPQSRGGNRFRALRSLIEIGLPYQRAPDLPGVTVCSLGA